MFNEKKILKVYIIKSIDILLILFILLILTYNKGINYLYKVLLLIIIIIIKYLEYLYI